MDSAIDAEKASAPPGKEKRLPGGVSFYFSLLTVAGVACGLYLRWRMATLERSLWLDPAMLVWNVVQRGYGGLFMPLDENQAAPYGFLVLLKAAGSLGGYSEASLLVFPFFFAAAALVLFARLADDLLAAEAAPFAVWPMAVSSTAIYYAGEVKQYSCDLFATTLLLWLAWRYAENGCAARRLHAFVGGAAVAAWLSHSSLLVTAALLPFLWLETRGRGDREARRRFAFGSAVLLAHHTLLYLLQMRPAAAADLYAYHSPYFAPWPPWHDWAWYGKSAAAYFEFPFGSPGAVALPLLGAALGLLALRGRRLEAGLLLGPLLAVLAAAALALYPLPTGGHDIHSRLLLFTLPCVCLLIGRGFGSLAGNGRLGVKLVLLAALVYPAAARSFGDPGYLRQEMAPLVEELRSRLEPADQVYVYHAAMPAFRYYTRASAIPFTAGGPAAAETELRRDAEMLRPGRVWVVFAHFYAGEDQIFRGVLEERGERQMKHIHDGAVLELYVLREPVSPGEPNAPPATPSSGEPQSG